MTNTLAKQPIIPGFEILSRLGIGGMGQVFLARRQGAYGFEKLVAIKVILPERGEEEGLRAMFLDEARLLAKLDHPAIAQVHDFGEADGALFLVMEYAPGPNISDLLRSRIRMPPLICANVIAEVCRGLHAAHELTDVQGRPLNVVHRDVSPQNLVLTFGGRVKILDFGIALMRARTAPVTHVGYVRGKPSYLAPEQVDGGTIDRRTDIFAVAIVLHELLTGRKLFRPDEQLFGEEGESYSWREVAESAPRPSALAGPLPEGLDDVVMKGLAVEPEDRFQDARAMAVELERIIERDGCERLEGFVERVFKQDRATHTTRMRTLLSGGRPVEPPMSARSGTMVDDAPPPQAETATEPISGFQFRGDPEEEATVMDAAAPLPNLAVPSVSYVPVDESSIPSLALARPRPRRFSFALGLLVLAVLVGAVWAASRETVPEPSDEISARADPKVVADRPASDAKHLDLEAAPPQRAVEDAKRAPPKAAPAPKPEVAVEAKPSRSERRTTETPAKKRTTTVKRRTSKRRKRPRRPEQRPKRQKSSKESAPEGIITEW